MRLPPSVRYMPSRFQILLNPWVWLGVLLLGVVGVYAWEYRQNPGKLPWQLSSTGLGQSGDSTSTDVLLESLTPEEQAVAAELDNIELLLAQLDQDLSILTTGGEASAAASLNAIGADAGLADDPDTIAESSVERLNRYVDEYRFLGIAPQGSNDLAQISEVLAPIQAPATASQPPESFLQTGALVEAFARQQPRRSVSTSENSVSTSTGELTDDEDSLEVTSNGSEDETPTFSFDQTGVVPGSLEGLNRAFIRTTPNMSPPPGTTGYVPPASLPDFNRLNQPSTSTFPTQPSRNSFDSRGPSVSDRSRVLPSAQSPVVTPLEIPSFDDSLQTAPTQPRNGWEAFWD
ncbi:MAG: hypothetical protein F6K31_38805 [Symploca sp. SIO2G7]|nr:hypothetical protein [Symploca sp. SIO2G7]